MMRKMMMRRSRKRMVAVFVLGGVAARKLAAHWALLHY